MPSAQFKGRILPAAFNFTLTEHLQHTARNDKVDLTIKAEIEIKDNIVTIKCDLNRYEPADLPHIAGEVTRLANLAVSLASFMTGVGMSLNLDSFTNPNGETSELVSRTPDLEPLATAVTQQTYGDGLKLLLADRQLAAALRDLAEALNSFDHMPTYCARAVETIRNTFVPAGQDRKKGWEPMRLNLQLSESFLKSVTDLSRGPRHGEILTPPELKQDAVNKAWQVVNRFIAFRQRGNAKLPLSEFPLLT